MEKKRRKFTDLVSSRCHGKTNSNLAHSAPYPPRQNKLSCLSCANEAVVSDYCIIVTSSFSKAKGFFFFPFNIRSLEDALGKMCFFAYVISKKGSKLQGKNMQNIV